MKRNTITVTLIIANCYRDLNTLHLCYVNSYLKLHVREPKLARLNGFCKVSLPFESCLFIFHLFLTCKSNMQGQNQKKKN